MVEPISTAIATSPTWVPGALKAGAAALGGVASMAGGMKQAKAAKYSAKKQAKESKRKTLADLLNEALRREYESSQMSSNRQKEYVGDRAKVLQNLASQYVQALR